MATISERRRSLRLVVSVLRLAFRTSPASVTAARSPAVALTWLECCSVLGSWSTPALRVLRRVLCSEPVPGSTAAVSGLARAREARRCAGLPPTPAGRHGRWWRPLRSPRLRGEIFQVASLDALAPLWFMAAMVLWLASARSCSTVSSTRSHHGPRVHVPRYLVPQSPCPQTLTRRPRPDLGAGPADSGGPDLDGSSKSSFCAPVPDAHRRARLVVPVVAGSRGEVADWPIDPDG
jgi:hypothetical protein